MNTQPVRFDRYRRPVSTACSLDRLVRTQWNKRSKLERSLDCLEPGMANWNSDGGRMFPIMFKTRHALPLPGGRFSWPRIGRGGGAERLRNMYRSWPQTRHGHGHDPVQCQPRTQYVRVRKQSASAFCPRQQSRSQTVRIHGQAMASIVHGLTTATVLDVPQPGQSCEPTKPANLPKSRFVRSRRPAMYYARRRIALSAWASANFPVQIQMIPIYEHV